MYLTKSKSKGNNIPPTQKYRKFFKMIVARKALGSINGNSSNNSNNSLIGYQRPAGFCIPLDLDYEHHTPISTRKTSSSTRTTNTSRSPFNSPGADSTKPKIILGMYRPKEFLPLEQSPIKHNKLVVAASALRKNNNRSPASVVSEHRPSAFLPLSPTRYTNSPLSERSSVSRSGLKIKRVWMAEDFHKRPNSMMMRDDEDDTISAIPASYSSSAASQNGNAYLLPPPPLL
jgi:hypothetical protein